MIYVGRLAQRLERSVYTRKVVRSNRTVPTIRELHRFTHRGDVVQLVRTLPCPWLESCTVTVISLTCSTKRTIPSLSPPSRGKPADATPDGQPLTAASLRECSGYLWRGPVCPKQLSTERGKTRR